MSTMTFEEQEAFYNSKTFAGPEGLPVVITSVTVGESKKDESLQFVFTTEIASKYNSKYGPQGDPESIPTQTVTILLGIKEGDNQKNLDDINRGFGLEGDDRLVDDDSWYERFAEDHPNSVYSKIVGVKKTNMYLRASAKPAGVYFNFLAPAVQVKPTMAAFEKLKKKKAALSSPY
jgi:hypothetical protein